MSDWLRILFVCLSRFVWFGTVQGKKSHSYIHPANQTTPHTRSTLYIIECSVKVDLGFFLVFFLRLPCCLLRARVCDSILSCGGIFHPLERNDFSRWCVRDSLVTGILLTILTWCFDSNDSVFEKLSKASFTPHVRLISNSIQESR